MALAFVRDHSAIPLFRQSLKDPDKGVRQAALRGLVEFRDEIDRRLIGGEHDNAYSSLDPAELVPQQSILEATKRLKLSETEVRRRFEALADEFGLWFKPKQAKAKQGRRKK